MRHGGQILVDQLRVQGTPRVFCVPGESFLAALDGLHGSAIDTIVCRQEGGAAMMAEATAKLTGRPGIVFATRGPGATNASSGVHVARQDSTPMILFLGQVARSMRDREAFQEVDFRAMFGPLAKWVAEIDDTRRIPEYVSRAFHVAQGGRPGPVVLSLPEDMLSAEAEAEDAPVALPARPQATAAQAALVLEHLRGAARPLVLIGGGTWSARAADRLAAFAAAFDLPVAATFRRQDHLDNRLPHYVGDLGIGPNPRLHERVRTADLLLCLDARLGEMPTQGYRLLDIPRPRQRLVHVHPDADELGRVYRPELAICATSESLLDALANARSEGPVRWADWRREARADYERWSGEPEPSAGAVRLGEVVRRVDALLPDDAAVTNGAGLYSASLHRYFRYRGYGTQLAPIAGSMGYGLPAAIAAKLERPERDAVCFAGDGCFLMTGQELATAVQHDAPVVVIVCDNGMYGTIRRHQERKYPGRVSGTSLRNPDFAALAESYGAAGFTVERTQDFDDAFMAARAAGRPALVHLRLDADWPSSRAARDAVRATAGA